MGTLSRLSVPGNDGRCFELHLPDPLPQHDLPLLCVLDGNWTLPLLLEGGGPALRHCAILSLGYEGGDELIKRRRALDYTPPDPDGKTWPDPRVPEWQAGGAPAMLALLDAAVRRCLREHPVLDPARLSLFGHSYGGLFVLYALASRPRPLFSRYLCASPSLWWRDTLAWELLASSPAQVPPAPRVDILAGEHEAWHPISAQAAGPDGRRHGIPTLPAMRKLRHVLQDRGFDVRLHVLPGAGHGDVLKQATLRALNACLDDTPAERGRA